MSKEWDELNTRLRACAKAADALKILEEEKRGARRWYALQRAHQTYCKLRAREERAELEKIGFRHY